MVRSKFIISGSKPIPMFNRTLTLKHWQLFTNR
jgi:hypothetical protein